MNAVLNKMVKGQGLDYFKNSISLRNILIILAIIYPVVALISRIYNDVLFYIISFLGFCLIFLRKKLNEISFSNFIRKNWLVCLAMSSFVFVVFLNQIFVSGYGLGQLRDSISFFLFSFVLYGLIYLSSKELSYIKYGLIIGSIIVFLVLFLKTDYGSLRVIYVTRTFALIPYTGVALLMGVMSFLSVWLCDSRNKALIFFALLALAFGVGSAFIGQARGVWLAIPFFAFILFYFVSNNVIQNKRVGKGSYIVFSIISVLLIVAFVFSPTAQKRINEAKYDIQQYVDGTNRDTSLGIRFQLYQSAILMAKENPLFGIKYKKYLDEQKKLAEKGIISDVTSKFWHAHNEMLQYLLSYGILGLLSLISIYLAPFLYCLKNSFSIDLKTKAASLMGCVWGMGFFIYGLSEVLLIRRGLINFYVFSFAVLMAFIIKRKQEIEVESQER